MWIDPHETGLYLGQCAQYCGVEHAMMLLRVYVDSQEHLINGSAHNENPRWLMSHQRKAAEFSRPRVA